jgi:hypothetical protein
MLEYLALLGPSRIACPSVGNANDMRAFAQCAIEDSLGVIEISQLLGSRQYPWVHLINALTGIAI